ncbi:MAG TPA: glycosyltransferase family 4 protein [Thermoleophilaceae bacterium]|nr:glycosyltransferase family 4 protein [Thermoleophilaceae bacterium]
MSLNLLFLQEGVLGAGAVMGHASYQNSIRAGLPGVPDVNARFAGLPSMGPSSRRFATGFPLLGGLDLDLQTVRWHAIQAHAARRVVRDELAGTPTDVVVVKSHSIAMGLLREMERVAIVPVVDVTVWDWRAMGIWRPVRAYSRAMVRPSETAERMLFERAPLVVALTEWAREAVLRACPTAAVVRHHPGIDLEHYRPAERQGDDKKRVLFVGGRFRAKGGFDLIEALSPRLGRDVTLDAVTAEDVPDTPGVRVHRLSAGDPRLLELYQQADLFCLPTYGDSNPWVLLEAMACGTPVVSTNVGAIDELLGQGEGGVVHRAGDIDALRAAATGLLDDPDARRELGAHARARCEREFDARRQVPILVELLRGLVSGDAAGNVPAQVPALPPAAV